MDLSQLTKEQLLEQYGKSRIYERGEKYYRRGAVIDIEYDDGSIYSKVKGSYNNYDIKISPTGDTDLEAHCTCPFEGEICKHVIATLLEFVENKDALRSLAKKRETKRFNLQQTLMKLDKAELVKLILLSLKHHTNWESDLLKELGQNKKIRNQKNINSINVARYEDLYSNVCEILHEHNEYGGGDENDWDILAEYLEEIVKLFKEDKLPEKIRKEFIEKMFFYYHWGNSGLEDSVLDTIYELAKTDHDWRYIIRELEKEKNSWNKNSIARIYRDKLNDDEKYLQLKVVNLEYASDYLELANFWLSRGNNKKAKKIALDGLQLNGYGKSILYEFLYQFYSKEETEPAKAYEYLKKLFEENPGFENYKRLKNETKKSEQGSFDKWAKGIIKQRGLSYQLALVYQFNKEDKLLLDLILTQSKNTSNYYYDSNDQFADYLLEKYPKDLIPFYKRKIQYFINQKSRKYYAISAGYAKKLKKIYMKLLHNKGDWDKYIQKIRTNYKRSPALLDEFSRL